MTVRDIFTQERNLREMHRRQTILYEILRTEGRLTGAVSGLLRPPRNTTRPATDTLPFQEGAARRGMARSISAQHLPSTTTGYRRPAGPLSEGAEQGRGRASSGQINNVSTKLFSKDV